MKLGLFGLETTADRIVETATTLEAAGYESYWRGEHLVLADPRVPPSPVDPDTLMVDLLVSLTWAAAHTSHLKLGTGVLLLPQRNPVVVAKEWASFDYLSNGRLILGLGIGSIEQEYRAIGADYSRRGEILDEYLDAMATLWYDTKPHIHGRFVHIADVSANPRPIQQPVPIVFGGRSPAALRRCVARGNGWYGFRLDPEATADALGQLRRIADDVRRPESLGELEISVSPVGVLTPELAEAYRELGVHRLVTFSAPGEGGLQRSIDTTLAAIAAG